MAGLIKGHFFLNTLADGFRKRRLSAFRGPIVVLWGRFFDKERALALFCVFEWICSFFLTVVVRSDRARYLE